jgi:hypothetical protein
MSEGKYLCTKPCKQCAHRRKEGKKKRLEELKNKDDDLLASDLPTEATLNPMHGGKRAEGVVSEHVVVLHAFSRRGVKGLKKWEPNQEERIMVGFETAAAEKAFILAVDKCTRIVKERILAEQQLDVKDTRTILAEQQLDAKELGTKGPEERPATVAPGSSIRADIEGEWGASDDQCL